MQKQKRTMSSASDIREHIEQLRQCTRCPNMIGPVVTHRAVTSKVILVGQAPGPKEGSLGRPFAWTAGKTLFRWLASIGLTEEEFRSLAYMSAVCRCFPGKTRQGGDRVPNQEEIDNCKPWLKREFKILDPDLVVPVGRLAIAQFLQFDQLTDVVGLMKNATIYGRLRDVVCLPHPSGASSWFKKEPGKSLLAEGLEEIARHKAWQDLVSSKKSKCLQK
jgi:uracil-DNA glycosylase